MHITLFTIGTPGDSQPFVALAVLLRQDGHSVKIVAMFFPLTPTRAFPNFVPGRGIDRGPLLNQLVWSLTGQVVWQSTRKADKQLRRDLLGLHLLPFFGPVARQQRAAMSLL